MTPALRPAAFESLQRQLNLPHGDDFTASRILIAMLEHVALSLNELDRQQLGRLMVSAGHEIGLSTRRQDRSRS